jgi:outer membrane protein TolC
LVLPTYDLNRRAIDQAEAGRAAAGRAMEAAQAAVLSAVDTASAAVATARANLDRLASRDLPAARRAAANTARAVHAGEADRVEDLAARAASIEAELNLVDARRTAWTATADLEDALRRSFDPAEAAVLQAAMSRAGASR